MLLVAFTITSCKKEATLQTYLVAKQENPNFTTFDFSTNLFPFKIKETASKSDKDAYKSVRKVNVAFLAKDKATDAEIKAESKKLKTILSTSNYKTLMKFKKHGLNATIYYKGEPEAIDEMIIAGYGSDMGVGVARLLGEKMNPKALMDMTSSIDVDMNSDSFKKVKEILEKKEKPASEK